MNNVIISQPRTIDTILLEDQHKFNAYITIGLEEKNDFYVLIEFANLDSDSFKTVAELSKMTKALKINSEVP